MTRLLTNALAPVILAAVDLVCTLVTYVVFAPPYWYWTCHQRHS